MPSDSVHASPNAGLRARTVARIFLVATAVGAIESVAGVFALYDEPFLGRTIYILVLNWVGAGYGILGYSLARQVSSLRTRFWARVLAAVLVTLIPQTLTVWGSTWLVGARLGPETLWLFVGYTFVFSGAFIAAFIAPMIDRALQPPTAATPGASKPSFAERLPFSLRSAELWALESEGHHLRAITSRGQALVRMRLVDAIKELQGVDGARCHRSWWIARPSVADVKRKDGRLSALVLRNGTEVPVSRTGAAELAGWF